MSKTLVEMTAEIIQSQVSGKDVSVEDLQVAIKATFNTLQSLHNAEQMNDVVPDAAGKPDIDPAKSILRNKVICLECGKEFKQLSPKHLLTHGLTVKEYKKKYGFSARQPLCAKAVSESRSKAGKERGLPENLVKSFSTRKTRKK